MLKLTAIFVVVAIAASAASQLLKPPQQHPISPPATNAQEAKPDERGTDKAPLSAGLMNTGRSDAEAAEDRRRDDQKIAFDQSVANRTINLTAGLVIVGIIQAIAIFYTAFVTNKAASAAQTSANAAIVQLRAVVTIDTVSLENVGPGQTPSAVVSFKNTGLSPAFNVTSMATMGVDIFPHPKQLPDLSAPISRDSQPIGAGTGFSTPVEFPRPLQSHHISALRANTMAIYVVGTTSYDDAFGEHHSYKFMLYSNRAAGLDEGRMATFIGDPKIT